MSTEEPPPDSKVDVVLPDGTHRYWSTHCRHGHHEACSALLMVGTLSNSIGMQAAIDRKPAECKHCQAPCICPCHKVITEES